MTVRWFTEMEEGHSQRYAEHFREMVANSEDVEGEARFLDAVVPPGSSILDAGCGQGRTSGALHRRGHRVVGIDIDPVLIAAARHDNPGPDYHVCDLLTLDVLEEAELFDAAISAGNVITYVAPNTQVEVLSSIRRYLKPDAPYVLGFHTERYRPTDFVKDASAAGFTVELQFSTWDLRPWHDDADFVVFLLRNRHERS
jgi:SAM-dependent methyltransferase